jgi:hypothetical protein
MRDLAGQLRILLDQGADGVQVELAYARPPAAARLFAGRDAEAVARLLPTLYSLCATAQAVACAEAIERAADPGADAPGRARVRRARARLIAAETVREHLWRIFLDWPPALAEPPEEVAMARAAALAGRWRAALAGDGAPLRPGGADGPDPAGPTPEAVRAALAGLVAERVFGGDPSRWLAEVGDRAGLAAWGRRGATPAARLIGWLLATGQGGLGRCTVAPLTPGVLAARLAQAGDGGAAAPTWAGRPYETSPLTRNLAEPLIADLVAAFGNGLVSRLAAQLAEVARFVAPVLGDDGAGEVAEEATPELARDPGAGLGLVEAARGLLAHRVVLAGEQVVDYAILSPTDWNFHPLGVVAQGLAGLCEEAGAIAEPLARLFVIAVDPCVAFDLARRAHPGAPPFTAPLSEEP